MPLVLLVPVGTGVARAQSPDMVTDRPDQTESAAVVPRGLLQVETGYLFARDGDVDGYAGPGTLFRIGLGGRLELRIGHVGIVGGAGRHGVGDSELGAKINLIARADGWRPELALLGRDCRSRPATTGSQATVSTPRSLWRSPTSSGQGCRSATTSGRRGSPPPIGRIVTRSSCTRWCSASG